MIVITQLHEPCNFQTSPQNYRKKVKSQNQETTSKYFLEKSITRNIKFLSDGKLPKRFVYKLQMRYTPLIRHYMNEFVNIKAFLYSYGMYTIFILSHIYFMNFCINRNVHIKVLFKITQNTHTMVCTGRAYARNWLCSSSLSRKKTRKMKIVSNVKVALNKL